MVDSWAEKFEKRFDFNMKNIRKTEENPAAVLVRKRENLISDFLRGEAPDFLLHNASLLDAYFQDCFERSRIGPGLNITRNPYAVIALGGYGRKEQCVFSDVDLLILFEKKVLDNVENLIQEMVYPLWDIGLDVGHATRSVKDCVDLAKKDVAVLTSLLDARFICGMSNVYMTLIDQMRQKVVSGKESRIIRWLVEGNSKRHDYFGDSTYSLEPNIKEGAGGLRDYHTMLWIGRIRSGVKDPRDLEYEGFLSHNEYQGIEEALKFIFEVRNRLHYLTGRKSDRLHFEYQIRLAQDLGFKPHAGQTPVERFLGKLHGEMDYVKQQYGVFLHELGYQIAAGRRKKEIRQTRVEDLEINRGMINFTSSEKILNRPILLLEIFKESDRYGLPLSAEAKRLVREFNTLIDGPFIAWERTLKLFERILVQGDPAYDALDGMLETGILVRLIPEFENIINRIQFDEYHIYPVDKHSLHTVRMIQEWRKQGANADESLCGKVYSELDNPNLVHWAALLHDIGKGVPSDDHSRCGAEIVPRILKRFGFQERDADTVSFLVKEHLLLMKIATRRDINDEETCIYCARRIQDIERLKMLYLLTAADSISTGPNAWSEWTGLLVRNLFLRVLKILEKGELASEKASVLMDEKKTRVMATVSLNRNPASLDPLIQNMSPRYLLYASVEEIAEHVRLFEKLGNNDFVWDVKGAGESETRTVTVCAKDAPGLFSKIAGTFTLNGINILNAQVFTWRNNIALDIFEVKPPPDPMFEEERWEKTQKDLQSVLNNTLDLEPALKERMKTYRPAVPPIGNRPVQVRVDNESSSFFTIVEVFAYDYLGLLYDITDALYRLGLDVWVSKISTKVDQVVDVFYVRDYDGQKHDSREQEEHIKASLTAVIRTFQ
jgi:[protein-PII] uridylyltransferase